MAVQSLTNIIYKSLRNIELEYMEQNLPKQVYIDYLEFMISDDEFRERFVSVYDFENLNDKDTWTITTITQSYAIRHFLDYYIYMFEDSRQLTQVQVQSYGKEHSGLCGGCSNGSYICFSYNRIIRLSEIVELFCKNNKFWCVRCKIVPLFRFYISD